MNRKDKRNLNKKLKKSNLSTEQINNITTRLKIQQEKITSNPTTCFEGEKVKLDYDRIISYPGYSNLREEYKKFVENNKDKIFTVEFDTYKKEFNIDNKDTMVCLVEDESNPKWLFWAGDLIPVSFRKKEFISESVNKNSELIQYMNQVEEKIKN